MSMLYIACSALFTAIYLQSTQEFERASLENLTSFKAEVPFQHRILVPALVAIARPVLSFAPLDALYAVGSLVATLVSLLLFRRVVAVGLERQLADVGALLLLYPMLWNFCVLNALYLPYDIPAVMLFCLGLVGILERRPWIVLLAVVVGAFNRETIAFLTLAFVAHSFGALPATRLLGWSLAQGAALLAVKICLSSWFQNTPGSGLFELQFGNNFEVMTRINPASIRATLIFGGLWLFIPLGWARLPPQLRRLLWIAPPFVGAIAVFGIVWETRIYNELTPVLTLAALAAFRRADRDASARRPSPSTSSPSATGLGHARGEG